MARITDNFIDGEDSRKALNAPKASPVPAPAKDPLASFVANANTRQKELDALLAQANANIVAAGGTPKPQPFTQPMTIAGQTKTPTKLTPQEIAAKQTADAQAAAVKPVLTPEEEAAGFTIQWVRTGAAGAGEWRKIKPASVGTSAGGTGGGASGGTGGSNQPSTSVDATLVSTETDAYGNVIGVYSDGTTKTLISSGRKYKSTVDMDAYALLEQTFKDFGLEELTDTIKGYMERGIGSEQAALEIRKSQPYINRFRGNEIRRQVGLNVLSEAEYLTLENSYNETLRAYGLQGYFGTDRKAAQSKMADIIGNDISSTEFKDRIDTVVTRVQNADPTIKSTLRSFYNIGDADLVQYFLNPKDNLPKLQEKVTAAEIGSAALGQGLITDVTAATALAQFGVTRQQALEGYSRVGETLPTAQKLSGIYGEEKIDYTQKTAEEEVFKGLASAERKRRQLAAREVASFGGASGVSKSAFGSATGGAF